MSSEVDELKAEVARLKELVSELYKAIDILIKESEEGQEL